MMLTPEGQADILRPYWVGKVAFIHELDPVTLLPKGEPWYRGVVIDVRVWGDTIMALFSETDSLRDSVPSVPSSINDPEGWSIRRLTEDGVPK